MAAQRIDEIVELLEAFALGEIELPGERVMAALKLLDLMIPDVPPDDGAEVLMSADDPDVLVFRPKFAS
jgi:hypothetical protein